MLLRQESSGGTQWDYRTHINRHGRLPVAFKGYELDVDGKRSKGDRSSPHFSRVSRSSRVEVAVPEFWENFPKSISATEDELRIDLFPVLAEGAHELQGGEQKTHEVVYAFGSDQGSPMLEWVRAPRIVHATPEYYASSAAVRIRPKSETMSDDYEALIDSALVGPTSLVAKRERVDEYGWRNYGDIHADHESAFYKGPEPLPVVSHYNNQYDAINGFALQFLRSVDIRWWHYMDALARHVVDIDVYHTDADKTAYNHGLFWHTAHYVDAQRSTHRTYPSGTTSGGGPGCGHLYTAGLTLHYYLTGAAASRQAAIELANYVITCDDGSRTPLRWLSTAATGHASSSGHPPFHGPGRATGNAIAALVDGLSLTGDDRFLAKAVELMRRAMHPRTDLSSLDLANIEARWFYTIHAQALLKYLDWCRMAEVNEDPDTQYALQCVLRLAQWTLEHDPPYLSRAEELEYPTETWPAQDMRKSDILLGAAELSPDPDFALRCRAAGADFFHYSVLTLSGMQSTTRSTVLLLGLGRFYLAPMTPSWPHSYSSAPDEGDNASPPVRFVTQKEQFLSRLLLLALVSGGLVLALVLSLS